MKIPPIKISVDWKQQDLMTGKPPNLRFVNFEKELKEYARRNQISGSPTRSSLCPDQY